MSNDPIKIAYHRVEFTDITGGVYHGPLNVKKLCIPPNLGGIIFALVVAEEVCQSSIGNAVTWQNCTIGTLTVKPDCECPPNQPQGEPDPECGC